MTEPLFLTPDELQAWTGYKRPKRIAEQLRTWRVQFRTPADGWPRVPRSAIHGGRELPTTETPNYGALPTRPLAPPMGRKTR